MTDMRPNAASLAQIGAADPAANVWLVANAGSGKTKVLTDRVARLLLRGVDPQNILCLTYTKAAAAEMQNRLFKRLGEWAMAEDGALIANLQALGEDDLPEAEGLRRARQLFARAIETPGGIRIQTIHSFCAGLLRRFPLEAGVSPGFGELDDRSAALLRDDILEQMTSGPQSALFEAILPELGERVEDLLTRIVGLRAELLSAPDPDLLREAFGLPRGYEGAALLEETFAPGDAALIQALIPLLAASSKVGDQKAAATLAKLRQPFSLYTMSVLEGLFLFGATAKAPFAAKLDSFPTKDCRATLGPLLEGLQGLMGRIEASRTRRLALVSYEKSLALHAFAQAFLARYEAAKTARGWLDFDDFITRATDLLTDPAIAPWVLYRLDGSIDHILVDEAQDTSPAQWRIIAALTEEFTAGQGASDRARSLFVVGDKKQSIYSFQGANVVAFERWKEQFRDNFDAAFAPISEHSLIHSFRSSWAILTLVDLCFDGPMQQSLGGAFRHQPFHEALPGRVDLWPLVPKPEKPEEKDWFDPIDLMGETDAPVVLSRQIAAEIRQLIESGAQIPDHRAPSGFRALRAGDVLVLVQRRGEIFDAIIRACKAEGLPIAGPDRLTLSQELAVRDILSVLAFLNLAEDDLSLATALRSPLLGWDEEALYRLAQPRPPKTSLWEALRKSARHPDTMALLDDLRSASDYLRPYELIDLLLTRHQGRARLLGRFGPEAADAIDELSQQALAYERAEVSSLSGFLTWMAAGDVEVKRQAEAEGAQIRVMTVHGSKGLEAPLVILPDTADRSLRENDIILPIGEGLVTWAGRKDEDPPRLAETKAARAAAREAENLRLLYVAMTRAKHWLIIGAAGEAGPGSWYDIIRQGLQKLPVETQAGGRIRHQFGDFAPDAPAETLPQAPPRAPDYTRIACPPPPPAPVKYSPSGLGGAAIIMPEAEWRDGDGPHFAEDDPLERGTILHLLLEHLPAHPRADWPQLAQRFAAAPHHLAEAEAILARPELAALFSPAALCEVEITVPWAKGYLTGAIDRLILQPDLVQIVDFKTNQQVPQRPEDVPEAYLRQLGAYGHALAAIYPTRRIESAILWTETRQLMVLPAALTAQALARAAQAS